MNRIFSMYTKFSLSMLIMLLGCFLTSCLKDSDNRSIQGAGIALINASPGSPNLDIISDGDRRRFDNFSYDSVTGYLGAYPGFRVFGITLPNSVQLLASQQFYLKPGVAYSLFIADTLKDAKLICFEDSLDLPDAAEANIRFVNVSADAPALDLILKGNTNTTIENIAFSKATGFTTINPSDNYSLQIVTHGDKNVLAGKDNVKIEAGKIYTVWAKGILHSNSEKTKISIGIMRNR